MKKTKSNEERTVNEYVPESKKKTPKGPLGKVSQFSTLFYPPNSKCFSLAISPTTVRNSLLYPQGLILFYNLFPFLPKVHSSVSENNPMETQGGQFRLYIHTPNLIERSRVGMAFLSLVSNSFPMVWVVDECHYSYHLVSTCSIIDR